MASYVHALCLLALLAGCSRAQEVPEQTLYDSELWQSGSRAVLIRAQGERSGVARVHSFTHTLGHSDRVCILHMIVHPTSMLTHNPYLQCNSALFDSNAVSLCISYAGLVSAYIAIEMDVLVQCSGGLTDTSSP